MELSLDVKSYVKLRRKLMALVYARRSGFVAKTLKAFNVPKETYYKWKKIFDKDGADGLLKKHPIACNHPKKNKEEVIEHVLSLRKEYQLGSWRNKWSLERFPDISFFHKQVLLA